MSDFYYSPEPASQYVNAEGDGPGKWYQGEPARFNLVWVLFPEIDSYITGKKQVVPFGDIGRALAIMTGDPDLAHRLTQKPTKGLIYQLEPIRRALKLETNLRSRLRHFISYEDNVVSLSDRRSENANPT